MATSRPPLAHLVARILSPPKPFVCRSCLSRLTPRSKAFDSQSPYSTYSPTTPSPPPSGYASLASRGLLSLTGPSATNYLQGAVTANLMPSSSMRGSGFFAAFLNAQGRVLHDVFIYPDPSKETESWLIEVDAEEAPALLKHIRRYKLRSKFDVRLVDSGELAVWSVWKDEKDGWTAHTLGGGEGSVKKGEIGCVDSRAPGMGRRLVLEGGKRPEAEDGEEIFEEAYTVRRYLKGVAEGQREILRETALPQESNIDYMGGIDYRKGCYVGQELTIRTHHTGVVRKRILPVMLYGEGEDVPKTLDYRPDVDIEKPPAETSIGRVEKRGRSAGKWLTGVGNIGLGLCRLEIMTDATVQGEAGGFKEGDEFKFEWEKDDGTPMTAKVKAFVPTWHLTR